MTAAGILLSATLIFVAVWLQQNEVNGWSHESYDEPVDQSYLTQRRRSRKRVNYIIGGCGVLILIATLAGPGPVFVGAWSCVAFALMTVVGLAMVDFVRTQRYHSDKLARIRQHASSNDD